MQTSLVRYTPQWGVRRHMTYRRGWPTEFGVLGSAWLHPRPLCDKEGVRWWDSPSKVCQLCFLGMGPESNQPGKGREGSSVRTSRGISSGSTPANPTQPLTEPGGMPQFSVFVVGFTLGPGSGSGVSTGSLLSRPAWESGDFAPGPQATHMSTACCAAARRAERVRHTEPCPAAGCFGLQGQPMRVCFFANPRSPWK